MRRSKGAQCKSSSTQHSPQFTQRSPWCGADVSAPLHLPAVKREAPGVKNIKVCLGFFVCFFFFFGAPDCIACCRKRANLAMEPVLPMEKKRPSLLCRGGGRSPKGKKKAGMLYIKNLTELTRRIYRACLILAAPYIKILPKSLRNGATQLLAQIAVKKL